MHGSDTIDRFLAIAEAEPDRPAISHGGTVISYGAFARRVREFAGRLARHAGHGVLVALPQGPEAYAAMLGAGLAGCFYVPANLESPVAKIQKIAGLLNPKAILAAPALGAQLGAAVPEADLIDPAALDAGSALAGSGSRHDIAYVIFTSGSTGEPKGVVVGRPGVEHYLDWVRRSETILPTDRVSQHPNIAFDMSVTDIYGAFGVGATLCPLLSASERMFPARVIAREGITSWNSTPSVFSLMMRAREATTDNLKTLRLVNFAGEALLPAHIETLFALVPGVTIQNAYGPTEATVTVTEMRMKANDPIPAFMDSVSIGPAIADMGLHVVGGPSADEGELVLTGPQLALGYWQAPEKTDAAFRTITVEGKPIRAYFTGDWVERRNGHIVFRERVDHQVKLHGMRLELGEVAQAIRAEGHLVTCVLKWREELVAVIEAEDGRVDVEGLRAALARRLEKHAVPATIQTIGLMPRSDNDKIDRGAVMRWLEAGEGRQA